MADYKFTDLKLVAQHVPDYSLEVGADGNKRQEELPGHIRIGTEIEGVFVPLAQIKAPGLFADIERAKQSNDDDAAASEPQVQQSGTGTDVPTKRGGKQRA
jgi:hypothetical protein